MSSPSPSPRPRPPRLRRRRRRLLGPQPDPQHPAPRRRRPALGVRPRRSTGRRKAVGRQQHRAGRPTTSTTCSPTPTVEAVAVATPADTHVPVALACLEAGKHVLVEKPLATSVDEAEKLVEVAEPTPAWCSCATTPTATRRRSGASRDMVARRRARRHPVRRLGPHQPRPRPARRRRVLGPGAPRPVDPRLRAARRTPARWRWRRTAPTRSAPARPASATSPCRWPTAASPTCHVNWLSPTKVRTMHVGGSRRMLVWDDLNPTQRLSVHDRGVELSGDR